jgi:hypothetical protein
MNGDPKVKRNTVLVIAIAITIFPTIQILYLFGLSIVWLDPRISTPFGAVWKDIVSMAISLALVISFMKRPRQLRSIYWFVPLYFASVGITRLMSLIGYYFYRYDFEMPLSAVGRLFIPSVLLLLLTILIWHYRPRFSESQDQQDRSESPELVTPGVTS